MAKNKSYNVQQKKCKNKNQVIAGGYISSLAGVNQTERAERYTLERRGTGIYENKKRKKMLKPKHKNSRNYLDSCVYFFAKIRT